MLDRIKKLGESKAARTALPAIAGFIGYGSWAAFCNMGHGWQMSLQSGLVQGTLSLGITLVFNGVMEFVYGRLQLKFLSMLITIVGFISVSFTVNTLAGTPEVIATIAPGSIIGSIYVVSYIKGLAAIAAREASS